MIFFTFHHFFWTKRSKIQPLLIPQLINFVKSTHNELTHKSQKSHNEFHQTTTQYTMNFKRVYKINSFTNNRIFSDQNLAWLLARPKKKNSSYYFIILVLSSHSCQVNKDCQLF